MAYHGPVMSRPRPPPVLAIEKGHSEPSGAVYMGCFRECGLNVAGCHNRTPDFPHRAPKTKNTASFAECHALAQKATAAYFALQYGGECAWGPRFGSLGTSELCVMPCRAHGQTKHMCGGFWASSVFKTKL